MVSLGLDFELGVVAFWNKLDIFMGYSYIRIRYSNFLYVFMAKLSCHTINYFQPKRIAVSDLWII